MNKQYRSKPKEAINGVVLLDKATGLSSNKALQRVKSMFNAKKAGHTGSLDPLATGLLPVCFGQATKVCSYLLDSHKKYQTVIKLGETTDTLDSEGEVLAIRPVSVTEQQLKNALIPFRGAIKQVPPMYSALKKDGQPLYKLARQGKSVERPARDMFVYNLDVERIDDVHIKLDVHCSSGFYIRSLAHDLGEVLGCGAHVVELRRIAIKNTNVSQSVSEEQLSDLLQAGQLHDALLPIDCLLDDMPRVTITPTQKQSLLHGKVTQYDQQAITGLVRFYDSDNKLFAVGEMLEAGVLKTHKIFIDAQNY